MATKTPTPIVYHTIATNPETHAQFVELTEAGAIVVVQLANIFKASMPDPSWVTQHESTAFGKVINYRSANSGKRLKDVFDQPTVGDKTLASSIAGAVVEMLSIAPVRPENDPLAGL